MNLWCGQKNRIKNFIDNTAGNSIPLVLLVALVVLIIGGAVAYGSVQVFSAVRGETHSQMTYFAAEMALERSMCSLDSHITKENYAIQNGIVYTDETTFINDIINSLNKNDPSNPVIREADINVNGNAGFSDANVSIEYSWKNGFSLVGLKKIIIPVTITATAQMENGIFRSYGKQAVATRDYEVWITDSFKLNGAVYTLGDMLAKTTGAPYTSSIIEGDVYVFGTGLAHAKRMEQYYNGGICVTGNATLEIKKGSAYTRNLVRAGTFDESDSSLESCAIVVEKDIVAQGIQVFGSNDAIVVTRDAYTFDDVELSGSNSVIAINGNYYGLNPGDGQRHDTSSAVINIAPQYSGGLNNGYMKSRIVINGDVFINGATFRIADTSTGLAGHKMEDVALAWKGEDPAYITENIGAGSDNFNAYMDVLRGSGINGFSVILQSDWINDSLDLNGVLSNWKAWINEIRNAAGFRTNSLSGIPTEIKGFCNNAMAANDRIYLINRLEELLTKVIKPDNFMCKVAEDIENLDENFFDAFSNGSWDIWSVYTSVNHGMPAALNELMRILEDHVQVFARKEYDEDIDNNEIIYSFAPGFGGVSKFMTLSGYLKTNITGDPISNCVKRYEEGGSTSAVDVVQDLIDAYSGDPINDKHFIILNFNPNRELRITGEMNGIIFSLGKVVIERGGKVNGAVIAAGRGYDPDAKVMGSAAENDAAGNPRLPRVVIGGENDNVNEFKNWEYAALVFENGGSIVFPGREELLDAIKTSTNHDLSSIF